MTVRVMCDGISVWPDDFFTSHGDAYEMTSAWNAAYRDRPFVVEPARCDDPECVCKESDA